NEPFDSSPSGAAPQPGAPAPHVEAPIAPASSANGLALSSLITGLLGLLAVLVFFFSDLGAEMLIGGSVLGLIGFVLGIVALKKRQPKGMAVTGLIAGLLAVLLSLAIFVFALIFLGVF